MTLLGKLRLSDETLLEEGPIDEVAERKRRDREELRKPQRLHLAESTRWPRFDVTDLTFERYHVVHEPSGERYRIVRGEILEAQYTPATAWFIRDGEPVFLEPA